MCIYTYMYIYIYIYEYETGLAMLWSKAAHKGPFRGVFEWKFLRQSTKH